MKVIALIDRGTYICQVSHTEIEKFLNLYCNKMEHAKVGDCIDLGKGYDFLVDTENALKKTREFITSNKTVIQAIIEGIAATGYNNESEVKS